MGAPRVRKLSHPAIDRFRYRQSAAVRHHCGESSRIAQERDLTTLGSGILHLVSFRVARRVSSAAESRAKPPLIFMDDFGASPCRGEGEMVFVARAVREIPTAPYGCLQYHGSRSVATQGMDVAGAADADVLEDLGDEIATLSAHVHAATHRLLVLIEQFDRLRGWEPAGYSNCARWLSARTGIDVGAAREQVRAARALVHLPLTSEAMSRGELSFSQVRALSRVAKAGNEAALLELARGTSTAQLERMVRAWKKGDRSDEATWAREQYESRTFSVVPDDDGMYIVRGRLTPEIRALLMRAIDAAGDALFRERRLPNDVAGLDTDVDAAQRRADAMGLLAERALAAGFSDAGIPSSAAPAQSYDAECGCA